MNRFIFIGGVREETGSRTCDAEKRDIQELEFKQKTSWENQNSSEAFTPRR